MPSPTIYNTQIVELGICCVAEVLKSTNARGEHYKSVSLRECENKVLWRISGPKVPWRISGPKVLWRIFGPKVLWRISGHKVLWRIFGPKVLWRIFGPKVLWRIFGPKVFWRIFGPKVFWRIFGPKRVEEIGEWIQLNKEDFHSLYSSPNIFGLSNQEERDGRAM